MPKKVAIIGAGPGGLTAAMLLSSRGYDVQVFEKQPYVGGRNSAIELGDYTFDLGPTFLMMNFILEEVFELAGQNITDWLDIRRIEPMYRLSYGDGKELYPTGDRAQMIDELERVFPGSSKGYERYLDYEAKKFDHVVPCLRIPYGSPRHLLRKTLVKAAPWVDVHRSLFDHLGRYFKDDDLKMAFTFQAKYLGMSPWECPGLFSIISYLENAMGIYHPIGGLHQISHAMAKVIDKLGGTIHLDTPIDHVVVRNGTAVGVKLADGDEVSADHVVVNADFGHAVTHLFPPGVIRKWTPETLRKKGFSCSTFMLYMGVDRTYPDIPHHSIIFSPDYKGNVDEISHSLKLSERPSVYVQNASVTDPKLAPEGHSTIYVLVPVANNRSGIDWEAEKERYRDKVLDIIETRGGYTDLRKHIVTETMITPTQFETDKFVHEGAVFNLAHNMSQMLLWRPHNEFEEVANCYLVGGGTHPGSGLPTIYESARISTGLILHKDARGVVGSI